MTVGPDLIDTFLPGLALLTRATATATVAAQEQFTKLETLVKQHQVTPPVSHLQQGNLFAQYTRVLQTLARHTPLLLVIDDLQWADAGSLSLLFHLGHHLTG